MLLPKDLNKDIEWLLKEKYKEKLTSKAEKDIEKLKKGEPVDYLIGFVDFLGCQIDLSLKPLIPRLETEFWVEKVIEEINKEEELVCLDIFSGSGCIGIAILKNCPNCQKMYFSENGKKELEQIKINLKLNKIKKERYEIVKSNVFRSIKDKFNYILANPPYIGLENKNKIEKSVYNFEPHKALFGGKDGLFFIKEFLENAKQYLTEKGKIYMEFDYLRKKKIELLLKKINYLNYSFFKDQNGKYRYVKIRK